MQREGLLAPVPPAWSLLLEVGREESLITAATGEGETRAGLSLSGSLGPHRRQPSGFTFLVPGDANSGIRAAEAKTAWGHLSLREAGGVGGAAGWGEEGGHGTLPFVDISQDWGEGGGE